MAILVKNLATAAALFSLIVANCTDTSREVVYENNNTYLPKTYKYRHSESIVIIEESDDYGELRLIENQLNVVNENANIVFHEIDK